MVFEQDHVLLDLRVQEKVWLERFEPMEALLREIVAAEPVTVIAERFHQFEPAGYTGYILLAQSHLSVHSWVDEEMITLDVLACAPGVSERIAGTLVERIGPKNVRRVLVRRGEEQGVVK